jgi:uncharacterized protein YqgQ
MSQPEHLIQQLLASDTKADLVTLFRKNPGLIDTLEGVARRIGKRESAVESEVNDLINLGLLKKKRFGNKEAIFRDEQKDADIQESIATYLRNPPQKKGT